MFSYRAYDLGIHSELQLPELLAASEVTQDLVIRFDKVERLPENVDRRWHTFWVTPEETCLFYHGIGAFLIRFGQEIIIDPAPGVEERVLRLVLLGPALSLVLHQRGFLILHGSAIAVNGGAVAFLGDSGDGKSTMAAMMHTKYGHGVVADDLSVVDFNQGDTPVLLPGFPLLKLWPEAATATGDNPEDLLRIHPDLEKRARPSTNGFLPVSMPLQRIYILAQTPEIEIEPLHGQAAFVELVRYSHDVALLKETATSQLHFFQCATLASRISVRRLKRPRLLSALSQVADEVEADLTEDMPELQSLQSQPNS